MKNYILARKKIIYIIAIVLLISCALIIILNLSKGNPYGNSINIDNLKQNISGLSRDQIDLTTNQLYKIVKHNTTNEENVPSKGALVRKDGIVSEYDSTEDFEYRRFVVDIDSLKQSYMVQLEWSKNGDYKSGYPILISCIKDPSLIIYSDFECKNIGSDTSDSPTIKISDISKNLPHTGSTNKGVEYTITYGYVIEEKEKLIISANNCGEQTIKEDVLLAAKEDIASLGYNPEDYGYELPSIYNKCRR